MADSELTHLMKQSSLQDENADPRQSTLQTGDIPPDTPGDKILSRRKQVFLMMTLLSLHACIICTDSILYPFFGSTARERGLDETQIGIIYASYEVMRFIAAPIYGSMISVMKPKPMCFLGSISCGVGIVLFGVFYYVPDQLFFPLCMLSRIIVGNGSVMLTVAMTSTLMVTTSFSSSTIIGIIEGTLAAGYTSGPALGIALFKIGGYVFCFSMIGGLTTLLSLLILLTVPSFSDESGTTKHGVKSFLSMLSIPGVFIGGFLTISVTKFCCNVIYPFIGNWLIFEYGISEYLAATLYIVSTGIYSIFCLIFPILLRKGFTWSLMLPSQFICAILHLVFTLVVLKKLFTQVQYEWWYALIVDVFVSLAYMPLKIVPYEVSLNLARLSGYEKDSLATHGILAGLINFGYNLGASVSPAIGGVIAQTWGFETSTEVVACMLSSMGLVNGVYLLAMRYSGKHLRPKDD